MEVTTEHIIRAAEILKKANLKPENLEGVIGNLNLNNRTSIILILANYPLPYKIIGVVVDYSKGLLPENLKPFELSGLEKDYN